MAVAERTMPGNSASKIAGVRAFSTLREMRLSGVMVGMCTPSQ